MAASRVYLGVHHGSDIAAGLALGALTGGVLRAAGALMASLEVGIVGLPNVGKTTLFNALTESGAAVTSFAAVKTSANVGVAAVPDERIALLAGAVSAREQVPATVGFADVSGLVRGAGASDGLGGEYLGHLRTTDALTHVVRCFADDAVAHVDGRVDPVADAETVDLELLLADQALVERRRERVSKARPRRREVGARRPRDARAADRAPRRGRARERVRGRRCPTGLDLLTRKPMIYVANVDEGGDAESRRGAHRVRERARRRGGGGRGALRGGARRARRPAEREAFLRDLGLDEPGMPRLARACYRALGLISFFTAGPMEARAWTVREGSTRRRGGRQDPLRHRARVHPRRGDRLAAIWSSAARPRRRRSAASCASRARTTSCSTARC